ncbi:MAG: VOC family protein [Acidimicrobiia bacterium]|nr:VOC family protein [Acidimicrobiia bacterium]NNL27428.1 VOC family protein [Acidimicrobiia bacterium]
MQSVAFWRDQVGLILVRETPGFAFFDGGTVQLVLNVVPPNMLIATLTEIVFEVDDVMARYEALRDRGVPFEVEPRPVMEENGRRLVATHFRDSDGNLASITSWVTTPS